MSRFNLYKHFLKSLSNVQVLFEGLFIDDLVSNTPVWGKKKDISRKKNIFGSIQGEIRAIKEEKEEDIIEIQVSSYGRIICNIRKI